MGLEIVQQSYNPQKKLLLNLYSCFIHHKNSRAQTQRPPLSRRRRTQVTAMPSTWEKLCFEGLHETIENGRVPGRKAGLHVSQVNVCNTSLQRVQTVRRPAGLSSAQRAEGTGRGLGGARGTEAEGLRVAPAGPACSRGCRMAPHPGSARGSELQRFRFHRGARASMFGVRVPLGRPGGKRTSPCPRPRTPASPRPPGRRGRRCPRGGCAGLCRSAPPG
ncbi:uncharacterized protein LOC125349559 [Perognathus longimembris pacificus]|uniref:uncharacterized protein LOC125349559 n=1 Tax=Perognathus longimembris pacificus TaxID=214514 RepID=UPI002018E329|nr:uncharacterized protein LOC125349559 [Perognathus longimembris pacificus]